MPVNFLENNKFTNLTLQKQKDELVGFEGFGLELDDDKDEALDFIEDDGLDKSARLNKKTEKLRKELAKLALGTDANICMESIQTKNRRKTQPRNQAKPLKAKPFEEAFMPLNAGLTDPTSHLLTNSTNIVDRFGFAKDKQIASLDTLNIEGNENGALSFLDTLLPTTANDTIQNSFSLMKDHTSIFGENAFQDEGQSAFAVDMGFNQSEPAAVDQALNDE